MDQISLNIREEMRKFTHELDGFVNENDRKAHEVAEQHDVHIHKSQVMLDKLREERKALEQLALDQNKQTTIEKQTIEGLEKEIVQLESKKNALPEHAEALLAQQSCKEKATTQMRSDIAVLRAETSATVNELSKGVAFFKDRLGLDITPTDDQKLRVTFTCIDPLNASREYSFMVHIDSADQYQVNDLSPPLDSIDVMLKELNTTNNFSLFMQRMRRAFKAL